MKTALTYDDIQLVPSFSNIKSRQSINLNTLVSRRYGLLNPIVASPMDTVCEYDMALKMAQLGGVGCIHRFMSITHQCDIVKELFDTIYDDTDQMSIAQDWGIMWDTWHAEMNLVPIMAAIGVQEEDKKRAIDLAKSGANILLIDVAHGDHQNVIDMIHWCKTQDKLKHVDIIAGNIATAEAAELLETYGADGLRVGIGGGSLCTTRIKTGFGVPNVTSLEDVINVSTVPVMADGGIRSSGDISKALSLGADNVMLGSLLAGTDESPGKILETSKEDQKTILHEWNDEDEKEEKYIEFKRLFNNALVKKISSYKQQDIVKNKLNTEMLINKDEVIQQILESELKCYYCKEELYLLYENQREKKQWTLDRINNDLGHNRDNVVISCLECNLKRRNTNKDAFIFTKQLNIIKKEG